MAGEVLMRTLALLLVFLLAGCGTTGIYEPGPITPAPPPTPWEPVGPAPPPRPPSDPVAPPDDLQIVSLGETSQAVTGRLGAPTEDPPENPGMPDWKAWGSLWVEFRQGLVTDTQIREVVDVP